MGSSRGGRLALIVALSYFPEPEAEVELLGSGYNADLMSDGIEAL
jgi:hypothetical protein